MIAGEQAAAGVDRNAAAGAHGTRLDERTALAFLAEAVILELREQGVPLTEMAVLFRSSFHSFDLELELSRRGMRFNGSTSFDRTNYFETFTASDENLDWALRMEADRMINAFIAKKEAEDRKSRADDSFDGRVLRVLQGQAARHNIQYGTAEKRN